MSGSICLSPGPVEARHRSSGIFGSTSKRKYKRISDHNEVDRAIVQERKGSCRPSSLKVFIFLIICGTFLTLIQSPMANQNGPLQLYGYGPRFSEVGRVLDSKKVDSHVTSHLEAEFTQISKAIEKLNGRRSLQRIGLLNFDVHELHHWQKLLPGVESSAIDLEHVNSNITWDVLYPEWIDEEEEHEVPICPSLPEPNIQNATQFNLIAVKLPCNKLTEWSRDVRRLHLQLSAAKLVVSAAAEGHNPVHVLFVSECFPMANLFGCSDLVVREGNAWLYKPHFRMLKQKIELPIGSCKLAVPLKTRETGRLHSPRAQREAYVTILHSASMYVCGAIAAAQSIRMTGSTRDLVIMVDERIREHQKEGLRLAGWKVRTIKRIRNPKADRDAYNKWNYSKFRLWQLTDYDKVIFIDADLLVLRNIDFLFSMPEVTATGNNVTFFNSGVMVIEPSNCTFRLLMDHVNEIESYNGGDQGYLNEVFTWWHRIPRRMNFLKHFWEGDEEGDKQTKTRLFAADPPQLYVLHYLGLKPWWCFRDYDCNWDVENMREFASDVAHARWWRVHDAMPASLQRFCVLSVRRLAMIDWGRLQAKKVNSSDGHWRRKIHDKRSNICSDGPCYDESLLQRWAEVKFTGDLPSVATL